jgi:hypothetical protein
VKTPFEVEEGSRAKSLRALGEALTRAHLEEALAAAQISVPEVAGRPEAASFATW